MGRPLTKEQKRRHRMAALYLRTHEPAPEKYRAIARWWRLHAEETKTPEVCNGYADEQDRLYADMLARPRHYLIRPADLTDFQWSQR